MENFISITIWGLIIGFLVIPILMFLAIQFNRKMKRYFMIGGTLLIFILPIAAAWWVDKSTEILLIHYDALVYSNDFGTYIFSTDKVKPENLSRVAQLESSYFGLGWPLKAIMTSILYIPVVLIIYLIQIMIISFLKKRKRFVKN